MKNRWVQLVGALVAMLMISNLQYAWTLFVQPIRGATGWKLSEIQWAFTLFILCETWVMPLEGWLIDRIGPRVFLTVAGVLCGIGWTAMGTAATLHQLYLYYALAGVGAAFVYSGAIGTAMKWFPDRRGLAAGIIAGGFGSGSALFLPLIAATIRRHDYQEAFWYTGIGQGLVIILAAQFLRNPGPEIARWRAKAKRIVRVRRNDEVFTTAEMLRTPHFYVMYLIFVMMAAGGLLVTAQAGPVAHEWGISMTALTVALSLDRVANGASRLIWGWISDRIGRETTMALTFLLHAACLLSILTLGRISGAGFAVALVLTFFTWGEVFSIFPSLVGDYFGSSHATSNYCFLYSGKGVASIVGGGLGALLAEHLGGWSAVFYGAAAMALLSSMLSLLLKHSPLPSKAGHPALEPSWPEPAGSKGD